MSLRAFYVGGLEGSAGYVRRLVKYIYDDSALTLTKAWSIDVGPAAGVNSGVFGVDLLNQSAGLLVRTEGEVYKYNLHGSLDASWGNSGSPNYNTAGADVHSLALKSDDTFWVALEKAGGGGIGNYQFEKFASDGSYDGVETTTSWDNILTFSQDGTTLLRCMVDLGAIAEMLHTVNQTTGNDILSVFSRGGQNNYFSLWSPDGTTVYLTARTNIGFGTKHELVKCNMSDGTAETSVDLNATQSISFAAQYVDNLILHSNGYLYISAVDNANNRPVALKCTTSPAYDSRSGYLRDDAGLIPGEVKELSDGNLLFMGGATGSGKPYFKILDEDLSTVASFDLSADFWVVYAMDAGEPYGHLRGLDLRYTKKMVAIGGTGNGEIWYGTAPSVMASLSAASGDVSGIDTSKPMQAFSGYEKVMIANNSIRRICDFANTKINLAASLAHVPPIGTVLSTSGGATMLVDFAPSGETFFYARALTAGIASGDNVVNAAYSINQLMSTPDAAPHIYDWTATASTASASFGTMPNYCAIGCLYRGRAVLAGDKQYPWTWYMSRQGNVFDWAYTANDAQSPVAAANADAGKIGDNITCIASYKDDYLILGCVNSVWVLRGDPAAGGSLDEVTLTTGVYGPYSYCWDGKDNFYFLGTNGIWRIGPNFGPPELLTKDRIPNFVENLLDGLNPDEHRVILHYDRQREGILVLCTKLSTGENDNYWFDLRTFGWFPEGYEDNGGAYSTLHYEADNPTHRGTYLGCTDGYIREFSDTTKSDDLGAIDSYVTIGPVQLAAQRDLRGRLTELSITTAVDTDAMNYSLYVGDTPESVIDDMTSSPPSTPLYSGSLSTDGRPQTLRPRTRGAYFGIRCYNSVADQTFVLENIIGHVKPAGGL